MAGIDGWMRKERELSLGPEGNFHKAYIQLFRGCSTSVSCFLISTWRVSLCSRSWKSSLWGPFLFTSLPCLLLQMTLGCVRRSAPGLEVWVALQTGGESLKTSGWPRRRHVRGAGVSGES